ncbi:hypothetical protein Tco_0889027 [Tanacetum coccineum]
MKEPDKRGHDSWVNERQIQTTEERETSFTYHVENNQLLDNRWFKYCTTRLSKQRFASQVDVNNDLSKPVTTHYLPKEKRIAVGKTSSNDWAPGHLVNSRAKVPSNKTTKRYIPVEQTSFAKKPERQIPKRHRSSIKKTSVVHEKTMTHRSCLRWKPTGKIFKTVGLRWVPTGKIFTSSTTKVDSEPQNGSNDDITNQYECKQTLDVSAGTLNIHAGTSLNPTKEGL